MKAVLCVFRFPDVVKRAFPEGIAQFNDDMMKGFILLDMVRSDFDNETSRPTISTVKLSKLNTPSSVLDLLSYWKDNVPEMPHSRDFMSPCEHMGELFFATFSEDEMSFNVLLRNVIPVSKSEVDDDFVFEFSTLQHILNVSINDVMLNIL